MTSSSRRTVALVLISRNEEVGLREVGPKIPFKAFDEVVGVDGNSTDNTVQILESFGARTFRQKERGLGAAMLEGAAACTTDALVFFHADGNENPGDLERMANLLREGNEFVVASRMIKGAVNEEDHQLLKWRKWANNGFAMLANILFGHGGNKTSDVTNGFRGISLDAWRKMKLSSKDLTMDYQMVIRALKLGIKITEFPTHEGQRIAGATNFASWATGVAELKLVWRELKMGRRNVGGGAEKTAPEFPQQDVQKNAALMSKSA